MLVVPWSMEPMNQLLSCASSCLGRESSEPGSRVRFGCGEVDMVLRDGSEGPIYLDLSARANEYLIRTVSTM